MKITTTTIAAVLLIFATAFTAKAQQTRQVGDFTGIKAGDEFEVLIVQGTENALKVDAPDSLQSKIKTEVQNGILVISAEGKIRNEKHDVIVGADGVKTKKVYERVFVNITIKSLASLDVSGSANVKSENELICDKLVIKSNGAGDIHLEVKAAEIKTDISGAGDVALKGSTQLLTADISGAGDLKASNLEADKAKVQVSGAGDAKVNVKQSLDADVSGAGSVIYKGNPAERTVSISGAGSVRESKSGNGEETAGDTTKFKLGKKKYMIIGNSDGDNSRDHYSKTDSLNDYNRGFKHWHGFEFGVNGLLNYNNSLDAPDGARFMELNYAKSYQFGLNLFEKDFHIYKNYIKLVTGFGFDFNHYALKNHTSLFVDSTGYVWGTKDSMKYKKNTLNVSYIKVPLLLEINTSKNPRNNFHIAGGIEFAYRIHSVTKQQFDVNDHHYKVKQRDGFNIEPFRYSAVVRIGYNRVSLFADYGLNRLFQKDKGPQEYPFTVGLTISI